MRMILVSASLLLFGISGALAQQPGNAAQPGGPAPSPLPQGGSGPASGAPGPSGAVMVPDQGRIILLAPGEVERLLRAQQEEEAQNQAQGGAMEGEQGNMPMGPGQRPHGMMGGMMMGGREGEMHHHRMPSGAFFRFKRGDAEIIIKCADTESTDVCVKAAIALIDKIGVTPPGGPPPGGGTH
jgi:hypothetical protein